MSAPASRFDHVGTYAPAGSASCAYASAVLAARFGLTAVPFAGLVLGGDAPPPPPVVLLHAWREWYEPLMHALLATGRRVGLVLHSALTDFELRDLPLLEGPARWARTPGVVLLACHRPLATALGVDWFPAPYAADAVASPEPTPRETRDAIHVGLFNVVLGGKNVLTQVAACRELARLAGRRVVLHLQFPQVDEVPAVVAFLAGDQVTVESEPMHDRPAYLQRLASMDLTLVASLTETFSYVAVESFLAGVPCVTSAAVPASVDAFGDAFAVADPTDPGAIARTALACLERCAAPDARAALAATMRAALAPRDEVLRATLARLLA